MKKILLIGGGGHCRSCIDVIESDASYEIAGIVLPDGEASVSFEGYSVAGYDSDLVRLIRETPCAFVAIGQIRTAEPRIRLFEALNKAGAFIPAISSPRAYVSRRASLGEGSIVMHGAIINAGAAVAENCIINSLALVEHDATIEAHCHISTGARINGGVIVRSGSFVGSGAILKEGVEIGAGSVIGAGQVVLNSIPAGAVVAGRP